MRIEDFDKKSETEKWILSNMLSFVPRSILTADSTTPLDLSFIVNGSEVDVNKFVAHVVLCMDEHMERISKERAVRLLEGCLGDFQNDLYEIQTELRSKLCSLLDISPKLD